MIQTMKYKLLSVNKDTLSTINIGDYIQALAALQYLPSFDGFVNREELSQYDGDECIVIMNGWFMHSPDNWPPSKKIHPFFVSFHINWNVLSGMLTDSGIEYLKKNAPIGCRDLYTYNVLKEKGIESNFTGCLTLTLGNKYMLEERKNTIFFVDPYISNSCTLLNKIKNLIILFSHPFIVYGISRKNIIVESSNSFIYRIAKSSQFFRLYSKVLSKDCFLNATYITHESTIYKPMSDDRRLYEAEMLVRMYAKAKFVVTSRLHCALPCLGLQTPVFFTMRDSGGNKNDCRYGGLTVLFNKMAISSNNVICRFEVCGKISEKNVVSNPQTYEPLAKALTIKCTSLINSVK